jgi:hypothetical protein
MSNLKPNTLVSINGVLAIVDTRQAGCYRVEFADGTQRLCTRRMFVVEKSRQLAINFWVSRYSTLARKMNHAANQQRVDRLVSKLRMVYVHCKGPQLVYVPARVKRSPVAARKLVRAKVIKHNIGDCYAAS